MNRILAGGASRIEAGVRSLGRALRLRLALEAGSAVGAYALYLLVRGAVEGREGEAVRNGERVIDIEQWLGVFWEPDWQAAILQHNAIEWLVNTVYIWGHLPVIIAVAVWLYAFRRPQYPLYRNAFLLSGAMGLLIFGLMPTAPPRLFQQWGFVDTASTTTSYYIWQPPAFVNQYAAVPSLHFGWNALVTAAVIGNIRAKWRVAALLMPGVTGAAAVLSANHFFVDLAAGVVVSGLGLWLATELRSHLPRRPPFSSIT